MGLLPEGGPTSKRARTQATHINVGTLDDVSNCVFMKFHSKEYILNMKDSKLRRLPEEQRNYLLNLDTASPQENLRWLASDIRELYSLVLEIEVWMTAPLPTGKRELGAKWVRKVKTSGTYKS